MYGKQKENRAEGQKFSDWVQEVFPGLRQNDAASAIWLAENISVVQSLDNAGPSHPTNTKAWFNEQQATQALPEDLQAVAPTPTITLPSTRREARSCRPSSGSPR